MELNPVRMYGTLRVLILAHKLKALAFKKQMNTVVLWSLRLKIKKATLFAVLEMIDNHQ